ncbi:MAG: GNAT family N-acetyltransferase [Cyclobacteriaceae bacterium]|nr:GNAT family N-acetyltransferase [Cyclobacteriaceae bacterium]
MISFLRTRVSNPDFQRLIVELDKEFWVRYPLTQQNFDPFNKVDDYARVILAMDRDLAVGCGCFRAIQEPATVEIKRMYVVPVYRNRGIGKQVLGQLEQWAVEEGYSKSKLETGINQPEAIAAYRKSGYKLIPNFPPYVDISESICMEKKLI